jgi:hypothetical protein
MQLNKLDNIVFLKDLESNIIEEAFIVLKDNVNFTKMEKEKYKKNEKTMILYETESLINNEFKINDLKFSEYKLKKISKKYKILKIINAILILVIIFMIFK